MVMAQRMNPGPKPEFSGRWGELTNMSREIVGLYPGTFDPIHLGHFDIIRRAARFVDRLIIGVAINAGKGPLFTLEERVEMVEHEVASFDGQVEVRPFEGLLMHYAEELGARAIVRGLRAVSDFEYEMQMVGMNVRLNAISRPYS